MGKKNWQSVSLGTHWESLRDESVQNRFSEKPLKPLTDGQAYYLRLIESKSLVVCTGPAGSGKSHMPCGYAVKMLKSGQIKKIVVTRPLVTCGQGLGFLPGNIEEKTDPYVRPLFDLLSEFLGPSELFKYRKEGIIEVMPFEVMRGTTLKDCFVIADECQNATFEQIRMLLTRIGKGAKMVLTGDASQADIQGNPFKEVILKLLRKSHSEVALCQLTHADVVRSGLARWLDEQLAPPREEFILAPQESWFDCDCPKCGSTCWFEDDDHNVLQCWKCHCHFEIPLDLDEVDLYRIVRGGGKVTSSSK